MTFATVRRGLAAALRPTNLIGSIALVVVLASVVFADVQNRTLQEQQVRAMVSRQVGVLRARLEGNINGNMQLVRGLIGTLATEPYMSQQRFATLASQLFDGNQQLRDVAAAPGLKVTMVYPVVGNEELLGMDYNTLEAQRTAVFRARDRRGLVLAGPVDLVQGGKGFVGRFPVFVTDVYGRESFWGVVSAVVDAQRLYAYSGLLDPELGLDITLRGRDGGGSNGDVFFGKPVVLSDHPVLSDVSLPTGSWQLAARPVGGWEAALPNPLGFRLLLALAAALVLIPLAIARHLIEERARNIRTLREREHQLDILSRRLGLALATSEVGVWEYHIDTDRLVWDDRMNDLYGHPRDGQARTYRHWKSALHPDDLGRAEREFDAAIRNRGRYVSEYRLSLPDGSERTIRAIGACYRETDGSSRIVGVNWDVTGDVAIRRDLERARVEAEDRNAELLEATARIEHTSLHDALTGLPNWRRMQDVLGSTLRQDSVAVLFVDLDGFKPVNDAHGHEAGDELLRQVAHRLSACVREQDVLARVGGDEFVVLMPGVLGSDDAESMAARLRQVTEEPFVVEGSEVLIGASVGLHVGAPAEDPDEVLRAADHAMYTAKKSRGTLMWVGRHRADE